MPKSSNVSVCVVMTSVQWKWLKFLVCLTCLVLLFFAGCAQEQESVKLYVDAVELKNEGKNEEAIEKLNSAIQANERFSLAYSLLGEIYQEVKEYEQSADSYGKATEHNPWSFRDYFNLGRVYQIMKRFVEAIRAYTRASELKPNHLESHLNTARCYYEIKDYHRALVVAEQAEQIDSSVSEVQKLLGEIYESQKDYEQAIASYRRALEIDSDNPEIMTLLAVAYLRSNRNEPAKELLMSVIEIQPDNNRAYQYLGYYYLLLSQQISKSYKDILTTGGGETEVQTSLKEKANEALERAIESYMRAIEINDKDWDAHKGLGVAYMMKAVDENSKDETLKAELKARAIQQWRVSLEIKPDQSNRERLLKLIENYSK
ncbi:MAG: tetratricopeptide repeat protein [Planctomycetota bacterium]